jgi:hypothetical protein
MHTPGPWTAMVIDTIGDTPALWDIVQRSSGGTVAEIQSHNCDDARLIAAAPQLLSALQRLTHPSADDDDLAYAQSVIRAATGAP